MTDFAYSEFLKTKTIHARPAGLSDIPDLPKDLMPFQRDIVVWALRLGRAAIFAGTGLGKTIQQLSWAQAISDHTSKPVLILTPLAVAQQTVAEAAKFSIPSVAYARSQADAKTSIVITNYDRVEKFDLSRYGGIVLDESSIIKSHESQTRRLLIDLCADIPYRLCCTATPAPNDYVELGNHAEFLGVMSQKEMLSMWFVHDGSIRATNVHNHGKHSGTADWRLKGHAETDFWRWLSTWAVVIRHPRDIGYDEKGYDLPPLIKHKIIVPAEYAPSLDMGLLFPMEAVTLKERIGARRTSIKPRVAAAAKVVNSAPDRPWLVWCHLNDEAAELTDAIKGAVEVRGTHKPDIKTERLLGFANGRIRVLCSKPSIAGFGMNFQVCSDMIFVGLNDSFESLFQAIRRCWRFGQAKPVNVYMVASELEGEVVKNLEAKELAADRMADAMAEHMSDLTSRSLRGLAATEFTTHSKSMEIPQWLMA